MPERYETYHPDSVKRFPYRPRVIRFVSTEVTDLQWRHELDHDTESVFWLLFYWLISAQPENEPKELIDTSIWTTFTGSVFARTRLLREGLDGATHSVYKPLWPLLNDLASILSADRHWLESSDPRNDPGYMNDALQRLIFQFILDHRNEDFMKCRVESQRRRPEPVSLLPSVPGDTGKKRSLSESQEEPTIQGGTAKRILSQVWQGRPLMYLLCLF
jgi:hypothetical protein